MKQSLAACFAIALAGLAVGGPAWAHGGGGGHFGGGGGGGGGHFGGGYGGGHYGGYGGGHYGGYYGGPGYYGGYYGGIGIYGLGFGLGYYGSPYYSPYYAYPPAVVTVPSSPPVYIEQGGGQAAPAPQGQSNYWYYCAGSQAYYPYIKECPGGWQPVAPQPPAPR